MMGKLKPTTNERLNMPTPHYFRRLAKRILLSFGGLTAVGIGITSTIDLYGLSEDITETVRWIGGITIAMGVVGGGIGTFVANLVFDESEASQ